MWAGFLLWLKENQIGDITGVLGVLISLVGFVVTLLGIFRSRQAAERAEAAAKDARESIKSLDTVVDFAAAVSLLEEIKRLQRQRQWTILPDRYAYIRKILVTLRTSSRSLSDEHQSVIQEAITNLTLIENQVEKLLESPDQLKAARFNARLSESIDQLVIILEELKSAKVGA